MANEYPPPSFHFQVDIDGLGSMSFQEVSGLSLNVETEAFPEGGNTDFTHALPTSVKYSNLVLKRGLNVSSGIISWLYTSVVTFEFELKNAQIYLLNQDHAPIAFWSITGAYPVKWTVSPFNAMKSELAIETIELKYQYFDF